MCVCEIRRPIFTASFAANQYIGQTGIKVHCCNELSVWHLIVMVDTFVAGCASLDFAVWFKIEDWLQTFFKWHFRFAPSMGCGAQSYANAFLRFLYHTSSIHTQSQPVMLSATRTFNVLLRSLDQSPSLSLSLSLLRSIYLSLRVLATTTKYTFFLHSYFKSNCVSLLGWQNRIRTEFLKKSLIRFVRCWSRAAWHWLVRFECVTFANNWCEFYAVLCARVGLQKQVVRRRTSYSFRTYTGKIGRGTWF